MGDEELSKPYGVAFVGLGQIIIWFQDLEHALQFSAGYKHAKRARDFMDGGRMPNPFFKRGHNFYWKLWRHLRLTFLDERLEYAKPFVVTKPPKNDEKKLENE